MFCIQKGHKDYGIGYLLFLLLSVSIDLIFIIIIITIVTKEIKEGTHFLLPLLLLSFLFHLMRKKALWSQTAFGRSVHGYESHIGLFLAKRRKGDFVGHSDLLLFLLLLWKKLAGKKSGSCISFFYWKWK